MLNTRLSDYTKMQNFIPFGTNSHVGNLGYQAELLRKGTFSTLHKLYASNDVEVKKMQGEREKKRRWRRSSGKVDQRRRWSVERRRYLKKIKRSSSRLIRT